MSFGSQPVEDNGANGAATIALSSSLGGLLVTKSMSRRKQMRSDSAWAKRGIEVADSDFECVPLRTGLVAREESNPMMPAETDLHQLQRSEGIELKLLRPRGAHDESGALGVAKRDPRLAWLRQQLFNSLLEDLVAVRPLPVQFAVPPVSYVPLLVDQIDTGPHRIAPRIPVLLLVVHEDGKAKLSAGCIGAYVGLAFLMRKLWSVDAHEREGLPGE